MQRTVSSAYIAVHCSSSSCDFLGWVTYLLQFQQWFERTQDDLSDESIKTEMTIGEKIIYP